MTKCSLLFLSIKDDNKDFICVVNSVLAFEDNLANLSLRRVELISHLFLLEIVLF
jgi:hypothetical protein